MELTVGLPVRTRVLLPAARHLDRDSRDPLQGNVLVLADAQPGAWLSRLSGSRDACEGIAILPADPNAPWIRDLGRHDWTTCFLPGPAPRIVAYVGERRHAFFLVFRTMGTVVRTARG